MGFIIVLLPLWMKTQRCLQTGLQRTDLSLMQSHHTAEGNGIWICLKDCRGHLTLSPSSHSLRPSPLHFFLPCQKLQADFVLQAQPKGHNSLHGFSYCKKSVRVSFSYPLVTSQHTWVVSKALSCSAGLTILWAMSETQEMLETILRQRGGTWQISRVDPHYQACSRNTKAPKQ